MYKLMRLYNQNRGKFWLIVGVIIFALAIIQVLNSFYKQVNIERTNSNTVSTVNTTKEKYEKESTALVSGGKISETKKDDFGDLIKNFLDNCNNKKYEDAYSCLSQDCKKILYPSKEIFIDKYCSSRFQDGKEYSFQAWGKNGIYVYLIKIYDNVLASGKATNKTYLEDYYSIVEENGDYKLNINGYLDLIVRNEKAEKDDIEITVRYSRLYMDNEVYTLRIRNNSDNDIMLDSRDKSDTVYVLGKNSDYKYNAFLHELLEDDLVIKAGEQKDLNIKFSNVYNDGIKNKKIIFSKIIKNYDSYLKNKSSYNDYLELEIDL